MPVDTNVFGGTTDLDLEVDTRFGASPASLAPGGTSYGKRVPQAELVIRAAEYEVAATNSLPDPVLSDADNAKIAASWREELMGGNLNGVAEDFLDDAHDEARLPRSGGEQLLSVYSALLPAVPSIARDL